MALAVVASLTGLVVVVLVVRGRSEALPPLARVEFDAARQRWHERGPANYDIEIRVRGRQAATYWVEVRDHQVREALRDRRPLRFRQGTTTRPSARMPATWSVPGMFTTVQRDLESLEAAARGTAPPGQQQLDVRVLFDPTYGYPAGYHRRELQRGGNPPVSWKVTRFEAYGEP